MADLWMRIMTSCTPTAGSGASVVSQMPSVGWDLVRAFMGDSKLADYPGNNHYREDTRRLKKTPQENLLRVPSRNLGVSSRWLDQLITPSSRPTLAKAAMAKSTSSRVWAALIWVRM